MSKWKLEVKKKTLYLSVSDRGNKKRDANKFLNGSIHGTTVHGGGVPSVTVSSQLGVAESRKTQCPLSSKH